MKSQLHEERDIAVQQFCFCMRFIGHGEECAGFINLEKNVTQHLEIPCLSENSCHGAPNQAGLPTCGSGVEEQLIACSCISLANRADVLFLPC